MQTQFKLDWSSRDKSREHLASDTVYLRVGFFRQFQGLHPQCFSRSKLHAMFIFLHRVYYYYFFNIYQRLASYSTIYIGLKNFLAYCTVFYPYSTGQFAWFSKPMIKITFIVNWVIETSYSYTKKKQLQISQKTRLPNLLGFV